MKSHRFLLSFVVFAVVALAAAQSDMHPSNQAAPTDAQKSFTEIKSLAGTWQGSVKIDPPMPQWDTGKPTQVTMRVTSRGNALVHEMSEAGSPDDPAKYDHPVTMFYLDGDRLLLTHFCDAGNRPRMAARKSADSKAVEFDLLDVAGSTKHGHMEHAVFNVIDADHHTEDWTFIMPGDKAIRAHLDLQRIK